MKRPYRVPGQTLTGVVLVLAVCGCSTVQTSRIVLDSWGRMPDGTVISNFSVDEVDSFVRSFTLQRGYEVKFADGSCDWIREDAEAGPSLLWMAEKPEAPVVLFMSTDKELIVTLVESAGLFSSPLFEEYTNVISRMLMDKFGEENVHTVY